METTLKAPLQELAHHRPLETHSTHAKKRSAATSGSWLYGMLSRRVGGRMGTVAGVAGVVGAVGVTAFLYYRFSPRSMDRRSSES